MNIKEKVLIMLRESKSPMHSTERLMEHIGVSPGEIRMFQSVLDEMVEEGQLVISRKKKYALPRTVGLTMGRIQGHPKGFAFLIPDDKTEKDVFIFAENLNGAMHNDRVIVKLLKDDSRGGRSREGEVVKVMKRANKTLVGTFERSNNFGFVVADEPRINQDIFIPRDEMMDAKTGQKVVVEITRWQEKRRNAEGKVIEILGHKDDVGTDILSIIRQFELPERFSESVIQEVVAIHDQVTEDQIAGREDLRNIKLITIDGPDAKDLDDAISLEILDNGNYKLGVHIADVSYYVKEGNALDQEALARGTSVYLVDRVIPMLPAELSNGICSLNSQVDRLALSLFMEIDDLGNVIHYRFKESVIRSVERMIYTDVTSMLEEGDQALIDRYSNVIAMLRDMKKLCQTLYNRRMTRGSIDFDFDEAKITLDIKGKPVEVKTYQRGIADRMIEEFMLVCNETVAEHIYSKRLPFMFRIHPEPDVEKLLDFNEFVNNFGYRLKGAGGQIHPKALQELLEKIRGTREERIISAVMLRSLQKAKYSHEDLGHFGLAAKHYCHFTSPIRRYPDLVAHRIIKDDLYGRATDKRIAKLEDIIQGMAQHCSDRERVADEAERETDKLKKAEFMKDKIGLEFDGIISGVTSFGLYVELDNTVEGLAHISTLEDDYYVFDEKHYCLIGERTRKVYRLGDTARIKVTGASVANRTVDFALVEPQESDNGD